MLPVAASTMHRPVPGGRVSAVGTGRPPEHPSSSPQAAAVLRGMAQQGASRRVITPSCSCRRPCALKQTFKDGPNRGRHFFSCKARRCRTFTWLDAHLPQCRHGPARLRRVLKMGPNNGRYFAACPASNGQGCSLFEWVDLDEGLLDEPHVHCRSPGTSRMRQTPLPGEPHIMEPIGSTSSLKRLPGELPAAGVGEVASLTFQASKLTPPPPITPLKRKRLSSMVASLKADVPSLERQAHAGGSLPAKRRPRWRLPCGLGGTPCSAAEGDRQEATACQRSSGRALDVPDWQRVIVVDLTVE